MMRWQTERFRSLIAIRSRSGLESRRESVRRVCSKTNPETSVALVWYAFPCGRIAVTRRGARPKIVNLIMRSEYESLAVRLEDQSSDG